MTDDWVAVDRNRPGRDATFRAANLVEARAIATQQLRIPSEQLHCAVVVDGESIAEARKRVRREAEQGPRRAGQALEEQTDVKPVRARGRFDST